MENRQEQEKALEQRHPKLDGMFFAWDVVQKADGPKAVRLPELFGICEFKITAARQYNGQKGG